MSRIEQVPSRQARRATLGCCAVGYLVCLLAGCYRPASLACAVSCADGAPCPNGLTCGATDQLCHAGAVECSVSAILPDAGPDGAAPDSNGPLTYCDPRLQGLAGLVGCYEFEGNARNAPGLPAPDMIVNAAVGFPADDVAGDAAEFDGITTADLVPDPSLDLTAFTIETWAKPVSLQMATDMTLVNHVLQYSLMLGTDGAPFCVFHSAQSLSTQVIVVAPHAIDLGHWTHLACTYDQQTLTIYVNGTEVAHVASTVPVASGLNSKTVIGGDTEDNPGDVYVGRLDELRIFNRMRTAQQICDDAGPACL